MVEVAAEVGDRLLGHRATLDVGELGVLLAALVVEAVQLPVETLDVGRQRLEGTEVLHGVAEAVEVA